MKKFRYGSLLMLSTLQFEGHFREYFVQNSKKVVALYTLPRAGDVNNFVEFYKNGKLIGKKELYSPKNIFLSYAFIYVHYIRILFKYFSREEKIYFLNFVPLFFFGNSIIRLLKDIEFIYWIGDYWPMNNFPIPFFRRLMHFYHDHTKYSLYLSNRINERMNYGNIVNNFYKKTLMWGTYSGKELSREKIKNTVTLIFIGVLVESQGIDQLISVVAKNKNIKLKIIGSGDKLLVNKYKKLIRQFNIEKRVLFPNTFLYGNDLLKHINESHIGIALYTVDPDSVTYYADPAKIKQYTEIGLPVIMTDAAQISTYIKKFRAGKIVERSIDSISKAITEIVKDYPLYILGVRNFNKHFNYKTLYKNAFKFLED